MRNYQITSNEVDLLESIIYRLESLSALSTVCGSAFITSDSFGNLNPREVHETFNNIHSQLNEAVNDANRVLVAIYEKRDKGGAENE